MDFINRGELTESGTFSRIRKKQTESSIEIRSNYTMKMVKDCFTLFQDFKKDHPDLKALTMTLFGSAAKGKERPNDIDLYIFFDCEQTEQKANDLYIDQPDTSKPLLLSRYIDESAKHYSKKFKQLLDKKYPNEVFAESISLSLIERIIDKMIQDQKMTRNEIEFSSLLDNTKLSKLFHFSLDEGVNAYRSHVINKLESLGELGQKLWDQIITNTENWDGKYIEDKWTYKLKHEKVRLYPHKLSEAKQFFKIR